MMPNTIGFHCCPARAGGITYCNGEQVELPRPLDAYDVIEVGKSRLLFSAAVRREISVDGERE